MRLALGVHCAATPDHWDFRALLNDWREDSMTFLRHDLPKVIFIIVASFVLIRLLRLFTGRLSTLQVKMPQGIRAQQVARSPVY